MYTKIFVFMLMGIFVGWTYQATRPPPPTMCGSSNGPPITAPRIKLRDGRHLAYKEHGVPKDVAKYKIILVHCFGSCRHDDASLTQSEICKELGVYFVTFDRQGYGESDPHPQRTIQSTALDIEELADQLGLGPKFYVSGYSMGGHAVWGCLKYIPHRLAGVVLNAPVINYWWPGFPANLSMEAYYQQPLEDQWTLRVAHYMPWLTYWWNTQKLFPSSSVIAGKAKMCPHDLQIHPKFASASSQKCKGYATHQGEFESYHRDMMIGFGSWEFSPMDIEDPSTDIDSQVPVHLWHGAEDGLVPVTLQRYIATRLSWIKYQELPEAGHLFPYDDHIREKIYKTLLLGEKYLN